MVKVSVAMISPYKSLRIDATTRQNDAAREGRESFEKQAELIKTRGGATLREQQKIVDRGAVPSVHTKVTSKIDYLFFPPFCLC